MRTLQTPSIWGASAIALCLGLGLGLGLGHGHGAAWSPFDVAHAEGAEVTPMQRLLAEDEMRQKIALYGLYADGDGAGGHPRDLPAMAAAMMTPDVVTELYRATGGPPIVYNGRDFIARTPPENKVLGVAGRHYLVSTVFDDVSASSAHSRTTAVYFDATKNMIGADCKKAGEGACGGKPLRTVMWVYHMTWTRTPAGWMIAKNALRDDN